tara:strand:+ start:179 stop:583 length:405 start_codon:yes stop_codon:yes gene_type:complete
LGQPQRIQESFRRRRQKKFSNISPWSNKKIDAFTKVSEFQKKELRRESFYSFVTLIFKFGLFVIFTANVVNLGLASHQRVNRNIELSYLLEKESRKLQKLRLRFDEMFSIGGENIFFKEQDQWITPNSVRVIWN